jgi:allophanate hydrolase
MPEILDKLSLNPQLLRAAYRSGNISPVQVMELIYSRIEAESENPIWITLRSLESVMESVQELEGQDLDRLPLYGIPFAVKDNIDVQGLPTTAACPAFSYMPTQNATVVEKLIQAGAIVIGKTNLDQFATGLVGTRSPYGACRNAFNPEFISGGSSSGSAIAVAKGLVSFALGTDTAGSGRVPAAFNNLVGLKPTKGLISTIGVVPACRSLDCVSIFALNTTNAQDILAIAAGFDPTDGYSRSSSQTKNLNTTNFRFGVPNQLNFFGDGMYQKLYEQSLINLQKMGGIPVEIDFTPFQETAQLLYSGAWVVERVTALKDFLATHSQEILPVLQNILSTASKYTASDVFTGFYRLSELQQQANLEWQKMDVLALPTAGTIYKIQEVEENPLGLNTNLGYYTNFVNLLDLAAIALPAGFRDDGLPFGITLIAPAFSDSYLCDLGKLYEQSV